MVCSMVCSVEVDLEICFAPQRRPFFSTSTSNTVPRMMRFAHVDLEMCFAPWRRPFLDLSSSKSGLKPSDSFGQMALHPPPQSPSFGPSGTTNHSKNSGSRLPYLFHHLKLLSCDFFFFEFFFFFSFHLRLFPSLLFIFPYCREFDFRLRCYLLAHLLLRYRVGQVR